MKILIFMTQFYQLSGAERLAVELAEELNKRGIHTDILSQYTEDIPGVPEAKQALLRRGIPNVHFLGMKVHPPITSMFPAVARLRRLIREHRYDIVETSMVMPTTLAAWATRGTHAKQVAGLHQVYRLDRENAPKDKLWRVSVRCNPHIRYYAISDYVAQAWVRYSKTPSAHTRTVYNAITDDCFTAAPDRFGVRRELGIPEDARLALYVGRLAAYKGIDTLLSALGPILASHDLHLLYVGRPDNFVAGTEQMLQRMEQEIQRNGWGGRVHFLPHRADVPRLMASADILVHPTRMEGFGLVLAEAMAAGLPIVASNVEGIPEVLAGTDSLMVPPDDPKALREAVLQTLHRSPAEVAAAIEKGCRRAQAFRTQQRTEAMIRLFEDVVTGRGLSVPHAGVDVDHPRSRA